MYYIAKLSKRKHLFQKAYYINGEDVYITNTKRGKKAFLKSGIQDVVFSENFKHDKIIGAKLCPMKDYDRQFVITYLPYMIDSVADFFNLRVPLGEIAVFSDMPYEIVPRCIKYARIITLVGVDGESDIKDGVTVRRVKRLKNLPDLYISEKEGFSSIFQTPVIDLISDINRNPFTLSYSTMSFRTNILPFEVSANVVMYLKKRERNFDYEITSARKKLPPLFTFC